MTDQYRILLVGLGGFVGRHLMAALDRHFGASAKVLATSRHPSAGLTSLDLTDGSAVRAAIRDFRPTHVVNLAGIASPVTAHQDPELAWTVHAQAPEQLGRIVLEEAPACWLFHVGSGLVYGKAAAHGNPVDEETPLAPLDTYGVTKAAGDLAVGALANAGLRCLRLRPFNHTGPGQSEDFAIPAFAAQIARIEAGLQEPVLQVGNLDAVRDFLDVRDVVSAYCLLIEASENLSPGSVFNIASGAGLRIGDALEHLLSESRVEIEVQRDPERQRPSDLPAIIGNPDRLTGVVKFSPALKIEKTLKDTLRYFRTI